MGRLKWYKRDFNAALTGMACLTLEERGAYNTVLDLIYAHDGNLVDDDRFIAGWLCCDIRIWKRIKRRLIDLEKLYLHGGMVRNARADVVIDRALSVSTSSAQAGVASGASRRARAKIIKDLSRTDVQRSFEPLRTKNINITSSEFGTAREEESPAVLSYRASIARRKAIR